MPRRMKVVFAHQGYSNKVLISEHSLVKTLEPILFKNACVNVSPLKFSRSAQNLFYCYFDVLNALNNNIFI